MKTPIEYMVSLDWSAENLIEMKKFLSEWDQRPDSFYKNKMSMQFDKAEREHCRNCINFWENRLKNENKPS